MPRPLLVPLFLLPLLVANRGLESAFGADSRRPNVVYLLADDLGWTGLSCFGSDLYETPNLDRLAADGMRFTAAYAACTVCSPTRASIMTGMYPARLHLTDFIAGQNRPFARMSIPDWTKRLDGATVTIADALRAEGYATAQVGKWHLSGRGAEEGQPTDHGFDSQVDAPPGTRGYFLSPAAQREAGLDSNFLTDYLTEQAVQAIDRMKSGPFLLYMAYHVPHTPIEGRPDLVARFQSRLKPGLTHNNPTYAAMVASLDLSVGRILATLEDRGLADNTLVIFTSDNGGLTQRYGQHDGYTENLPLRRGKGSAYEGGVRVPRIMKWPGVTPPGSVCQEPVMTIDDYPTILAVTGVAGDAQHNARVDGKSLLPLLQDPAARFDRNLFWHYPHYHAGGDWPYSAVRSGPWRLIESLEDGHLELYNLANDPSETQNVKGQQGDRTAVMQRSLHEWRQKVGAQMPTQNAHFDPNRATEVRGR